MLAQDVNGQQTIVTLPVSIDGQAVLGNFTLQFTDLSIPLAGIPIEILRTYDTLDASRSGDFGYGWSLGFREPRIRETVRLSAAEQAGAPPLFSANPFREGTRVYLTNPEGRRVGFTFAPTPEPGFLGTIWHPHFVGDPGVFDTLSVQDIPLSERPDGTFTIYLAGFPFNPSEYFLTTKGQLTYHYDQSKGLLDVHDRNNVTLTFGDNGITSSVGQSVQFQRDAQGRIKQIIDPAGHPLTYTYDAAGDLITYTNQVGLGDSYTYLSDHPHYMDEVHRQCGCGEPFIRTDYDDNGRLKSTTDATGHTSPQSFDVANNTETVADREGHESTLTYDDRGNITSVIDPFSHTTTYTYDANDNVKSMLDVRGYLTQFDYDGRGNVTKRIDAEQGEWDFTYNARNDVTSTRDALGRTSTYGYDNSGKLTEFVNALNVHSYITRDASGRPTSLTDNNGHTTTLIYSDGSTKPTTIVNPDQTSRTIQYNLFGEMTSVIDENGHQTLYQFDAASRRLTVRDQQNGLVTFAYSGELLVSVTDPLNHTSTLGYDDARRLAQRIDAINGETSVTYDGNGRVLTSTDPLHHTMSNTYDSLGRLTLVTDALNHQTGYGYDAAGNRTSQLDANSHLTTFEYDGLNRFN